MASLFTLARQIASGGSAWKYACRVVSTSNITLSGTQTIDGVALAVGDRVLVAGQTNAAQNGIYNCRATAWERSDDAKKPNDIQLGLTVRILEGTSYAGSTWAMTSPTTGTVSVGVTELAFDAVSGPVESATFSGAITVAGRKRMTASATLGKVVIALATSGHQEGGEVTIKIPGGTLAASSDLIVASDLDPSATWEALTPANDYLITILYTQGQFIAHGRDVGLRDSAAPTISSAVVDSGNPNALVLTFSEAVYLPDLTGLSLSFSVGTSRTITAIESVGSAGTVWTLTLSGNLDGTETCSLVIASNRTLQDLNGNLIAAGSTAVTLTGYAYDWSAVANVSLWLRGDSGIGVADGAAMSSGWTGRNPPAAYVFSEATNRPTYRATAGVNGEPAADFDGTNDLLTSAAMTVTNMLGAASSAFFVAAAVKIDAVSSVAGDSYNNDAIFSDPTGYVGMHLTNQGGSYRVIAYVFDGATKYATASFGASLPAGGLAVVHMRLSGGNLYAGINGVEGSGVACGSVSALADSLLVQLGKASTAEFFDGQIAEFVAVKSGTLQSAGLTAMVSKYV